MPTPAIAPRFGIDFPPEASLKTGDVLFPRSRGVPLESFGLRRPEDLFTDKQLSQTVRDFLGPRGTLWAATAGDKLAMKNDKLPEQGTADVTMMAPSELQTRMALLIAILEFDFAQISIDWFNLPVKDFLKHPLAQVLFRAFGGEIQEGFFIGHCGIVVRETAGAHADDGKVYIIEANATSFDHYGVAMRPYWIDGDGAAGDSRFRSWAGYRASKGNCAWHSRHAAFDGKDPAAERVARDLLLQRAKTYIGRSYGFFDKPTFGNPGRLYCSEYVYRVFEDIRTGVSGPAQPRFDAVDGTTRTWQWLKDHNPPLKKGDIGEAVATAWNDGGEMGKFVRSAGRPFFILTVQMLWCSAVMASLWKPHGEDYQACN